MGEQALFTKILMPVSGTEDEEKALNHILKYKNDETIVFLVFIIDETQINQIARILKKEPIEVKIDIEEKGWRSLYYLEEKFQDYKIRTNIQLLSGYPNEIIKKLIQKMNINLLLLMKKAGKGIVGRAEEKLIEELISRTEIPVLII